jgi:2-dehydropantoate 2-reductase
MPDQSDAPNRRVVIIGAGAIGSHLAASLRPGVPLLIIDRCRDVRAVFSRSGIDSVCPVSELPHLPHADPRQMRTGDVVVLATTAGVAAGAARLIPIELPVVCVANGDIPELAEQRNGTLSHGVVEFAVHCRAPAEPVRSRDGWLTLQHESASDATAWLAGSIDPSRQRVRLTRWIASYKSSKLILNSSLDPVAAVIGGTVGDVFRQPAAFRAFRVLLRESLKVAKAARWKLAPIQGMRPDLLSMIFRVPVVAGIAAKSAGRQAASVGSTLAGEVRRGECGEANFLCGAIIREGAKLGVPTPAHERAMQVIARIVAGGSLGGGRAEFADDLLQS